MTEHQKNKGKGDAYKDAFERIKSSLEQGFPLEAICLIESIMSDQLLSHAVGTGTLEGPQEKLLKTSFWQLIEALKTWANKHSSSEAVIIAEDLHQWRAHRNSLVHSAVKALPAQAPKLPPEGFWKEAGEAANQGVTVARKLLKWHRAQIEASKRLTEKEVG